MWRGWVLLTTGNKMVNNMLKIFKGEIGCEYIFALFLSPLARSLQKLLSNIKGHTSYRDSVSAHASDLHCTHQVWRSCGGPLAILVHYQHQFIGSKTRQSSTCATKQSEQDSKDTDAINNCLRKVQVKKNYSVIHFKKKRKVYRYKWTFESIHTWW